ncbi:hypothetical protein [Chryseobacterium sp.]|uniref:hypothetical protein n=1 Tax=Chryseobacterium sp. TaxID=1871047 RepID=UPI002898DB2A|nr:hypothetical protein [Chryseobacterium sp.]
MKNANKPINPVMMQQVGENEFRASRDNDPIEWRFPTEGLTKREYFAGLALQGLIANSSLCPFIEQGDREILAQEAVIMSDELLKALENEK